MDKVFIGHTRFSVFAPKSGDWIATRKISPDLDERSVANYRAVLFNPERLKTRIEVFTKVTIPQLAAAAKGYKVIHLVSYSLAAPTMVHQALEELRAQYPYLIKLDPVGAEGVGDLHAKISQAISVEVQSDSVVGFYRLDDDDVLSTEYFRELSTFIEPSFTGMSVSPALGITGLYSGGQFSLIRELYFPMHSLGLATIGYFFKSEGILRLPRSVSHTKTDRHRPVVLLSTTHLFFYTRNALQDTAIESANKEEAELELKKNLVKLPELRLGSKFADTFPYLDRLVAQTGWETSYSNLVLSDRLEIEFDRPLVGVEVSLKIELGDRSYETGDIQLELAVSGAPGTLPPDAKVNGMYRPAGFDKFVKKLPQALIEGKTSVELFAPEGFRFAECTLINASETDFEVEALRVRQV